MRFQSIVTILTLAPLLGGAAEPMVLKPATKWTLDYAENSCRLLRKFGDPASPTLLVYERVAPSAALSMVVISKVLKTEPGKDNATTRFLPLDGVKFEEGQTTTSATGKDAAVLWSSVGFIPQPDEKADPPPELKRQMEAYKRGQRPEPRDLSEIAKIRQERLVNAAKVTSVEIKVPPGPSLILATGSLGKPMTMLDECNRHQLQGWGLDPDIEDKIVRPVWAPKVASLFSSDDYPPEALKKGQRALIEARLMVDATGKITNCTALSHYDAPAFQKVVCDKVVRRVKYQPAELADGTKVPSYTIFRIRFEMVS